MRLSGVARPDAPLPESNRFGDRLGWLMLIHGDTCTTLEEETGIHDNTIRSYLEHTHEPKASKIVTLADYYGVTADFLLGRSDET